jgi:flagellar basal body rod protein FlgC
MQALPIAAAGLMDAAQRFDASARRMATAPLDNLVEESVKQIEAKTDFAANAAVVRATDEMTGKLLDILA